MNDFIFGTLATQKLRRSRVEGQRSDVTHLHNRHPRDPQPGEAVHIQVSSGPAQPGSRAWVYWTADGTDPSGLQGKPENGFCVELEPVDPIWDTVLWGYIQRFSGFIPGQPAGTLVRYRTSSWSPTEGEKFSDQGAYEAYYVDVDPIPEWAKSAVIYQVFPDRFFPGTRKEWLKPDTPSGFYGGTLRGITEKMDYIAGMGFNTIWLNPIFPSPSHHGYDATDLFSIAPRLGTLQDFQELVQESHRQGIRLILDFVPNHWSSLHPTFQDAICNPASKYRDWYLFRNYPDEYETFFGVKDLPQLNLRNPETRQHICDAAGYWLDLGVDGFRLDYAIGPSHDFWAEFRRETRKVNPECWTFGEVVDPPDVQVSFEGLLDGCLDFMLLEGIRQTFAFGRWDGVRFSRFLQRHQQFFTQQFSRPSFLDNHDMNRYLWACKGDERRLKLAALCQFTLQGPPVVYYGTEVGLSQLRDVRQGNLGLPEESRLPMIWQLQNQGLKAYYQSLISFRKTHSEIIDGDFVAVHADKSSIIYKRTLGNQYSMVLMNLSARSTDIPISLSPLQVALVTDPTCSIHQENNGLKVHLPALSGMVLESIH